MTSLTDRHTAASPPGEASGTTSPVARSATWLADPAAAAEWWRDAVIYQIYPRSFADCNGDGIGDLRGITMRLGYLTDLGVDAVWLSPFYPSGGADGGYDVADHRAVDVDFGTPADFELMLARAHQLGLRVIIDLVPNHTSDRHPWFQAALAAGPGDPERDRYHFRRGRGRRGEQPPNNWQSVFGGPAWTPVAERTGRDEDAGEWYLHLFDSRQPDLNWNHPEVRAEFEDILRFWLELGVDGFRVDVAHGMVKPPDLPDCTRPEGTFDLGPMFDQPGVHDIYRAWHGILADYAGDRVLVAEAPVEPVARLAAYVRPGEMHQALNFPYLHAPWNATVLRQVIDASLEAHQAVGAPTTWMLSNHDGVRHASRLGLSDTARGPHGIGPDDPQPDRDLGLRRARAATLLTLALPGSAYLYQGEELGLPDHTTLEDSERHDVTWQSSGRATPGRDGCRIPLPWSADSPGFGFSATGKTWLPQPADWARYAADSQARVDGSTLELYRRALRLRRRYHLGLGALTWTADAATGVLAFNNGPLAVIANLGSAYVDLPTGTHPVLASDELRVVGDVVQLPPDTTAWVLLAGHGGSEVQRP